METGRNSLKRRSLGLRIWAFRKQKRAPLSVRACGEPLRPSLERALDITHIDSAIHVFGFVDNLSAAIHHLRVATAAGARIQGQWSDVPNWNRGGIGRCGRSYEYASMTCLAGRFSRAAVPQWSVVGPCHNRTGRCVCVGKAINRISFSFSCREVAVTRRVIASDCAAVV